jgi:hypothetical protein
MWDLTAFLSGVLLSLTIKACISQVRRVRSSRASRKVRHIKRAVLESVDWGADGQLYLKFSDVEYEEVERVPLGI